MRTALFALVQRRLAENAFGQSFPFQRPDGQVNAGTNEQGMHDDMNGYRVIWPQEARDATYEATTDEQIFELLEYCFEKIAQPTPFSHHSFFSHDHYTFDQAVGRQSFEQEINRLFERNGTAFIMRDGQIERTAPTVLQSVLTQQEYATGDPALNLLLQASRAKFLSRDLSVRREALEKLWDAWERMKSLSDPTNKRRSTELMLDKTVPEEHLRKRLEAEADQLTQIGNSFSSDILRSANLR